MQARYVILRVLLEKADGLISIERTTGSDGTPDIVITLDSDKIESHGKPAIGEFLKSLQVYTWLLQAGSNNEGHILNWSYTMSALLLI